MRQHRFAEISTPPLNNQNEMAPNNLLRALYFCYSSYESSVLLCVVLFLKGDIYSLFLSNDVRIERFGPRVVRTVKWKRLR